MQEHELLIKRAQNGDVAAFEQLIETYERKIYNIALGVIKNPHDASDMAQEAIIKIYRSIRGFKGDCSFGVWIYRIVVNTCLDELRKQKKRSALSLEWAAEDTGLQIKSEDDTPEQALDREESVRIVRVAIDSLDEDYRVAILLRDIQELSYQEIADITNTNLGTVKSRISRARSQLKRKLELHPELFI